MSSNNRINVLKENVHESWRAKREQAQSILSGGNKKVKNDIGCEGSSTETWNPTTFLILSQHQHEVNWWVLSFLNIFPCTILSHRGKFYVNVANLRNFEPFASVQYKYLQWPQTTFNKLGLQDMYCSIHYRRFWAVEKHFFFSRWDRKKKGEKWWRHFRTLDCKST